MYDFENLTTKEQKIKRITQPDGWYSDDGGMSFKNPCPDASAPSSPVGYKEFTIGGYGGSDVSKLNYGRARTWDANPKGEDEKTFINGPLEDAFQNIRVQFQSNAVFTQILVDEISRLSTELNSAREELTRYKELSIGLIEKLTDIKKVVNAT